ncbi:MAG TPA: ABC transporter permease [Bryobacteraceae bacterium]|nr:ABC transporter permease [Bryobacteraceae bacterium]
MDLKFAVRSLLKNPGFTLLAVLVMALGIGANTAVFSVVNAVLLKPLPYSHPDRIVTLSSLWRKSREHGTVSAPDFHDWHDQSSAFSAMAYYANDETSVTAGSMAEYGKVASVTPEFFRVFEMAPVIGRVFAPEELKQGGAPAVLISYGFWQSHFGGKPDALGQKVKMLDKTFPIVGVLPAGFGFPDKTDIWLPSSTFEENEHRSAHNYLVVGRLKPDVTLEQAQTQMTAIGTRLEKQYPASNKNKNVAVTRMRDEMVSNVQLTLYLLLGAVALVLLIACANVANLLLAKATTRTREIAIRAAVGASRGRILRQLITESLLLAVLAGVSGLILAILGSEALVALAPANVPRLDETGLDASVLIFTLGISVIASLLFGLAPALHSSRVDLNDALKQGGGRGSVGGSGGKLRGALVVAEIALSVILLAGAGLLIKSFNALNNVALGFHPEHVLVMETSVPANDLKSAQRATAIYKDLLRDVAALPGVTAAGATRSMPGHVISNGSYWLDHLPPADQLTVNAPQAVFSLVTPGTFATLGIPLQTGRDFNQGDTFNAPFTAVVNEAFVKKSFPGENPLGHLVFCGFDSLTPMKIVGVVGNIRQFGPARDPWPEIFMPYEQHPEPATALNVLVKTTNDPYTLQETLRRRIRERSPDVPVKFTSAAASVAESVAAPRFRTLVLGIFAALAVSLAMAGVYGVMAYLVSQRSNEIGLRMALGASPGDVSRLVLREGMLLASIGLVIGLAGAAAATRLLTSILFQVKPGDPLTFVGVAILLGAVTLAASYIPARRASKVDPLIALRQE